MHEMVHIVAMTHLWGPPREIWEFKQEQLVQQIKRSAPKGGVSVDKTAVKVCMLREVQKLDHYNKNPYDATKEEASDPNALNFSSAVQYEYHFNKNEVLVLLEWLITLDQFSDEAVHELQFLLADMKLQKNCTSANDVNNYLQGWSNGDFNWIACTNACYNKVQSALDQQCTIRPRGIRFHNEEELSQKISGNWHHSEQRSSWVKLCGNNKNKVHVGRLNAIVSVACSHPRWSSEDLAVINETKIAMIIRHRATWDPRTNTISMSYSDTTINRPSLRIGLFKGIVIQQLVILGIDVNRKPIYVGDDVEVLKNKKYINTDSKSIAELVFFQIGTLEMVV